MGAYRLLHADRKPKAGIVKDILTKSKSNLNNESLQNVAM